ncbi:MAG: ArsJ-associated glyceraldehyde-3-phosphate dehydrogenase [Porticoccaceae bacterium]
MTIKVGINGFGRMGRLALRESWGCADFEIVHINEMAGDAQSAAHLLRFDSVHGQWNKGVSAKDDDLFIDGQRISYSQNEAIADTHWQQADIDLVLDCTGAFKSPEALQPYFDQGVTKVVVSAPIKGFPRDQVLNVVMGVNDHEYTGQDIVTAASCTTNCIAPVVDVIHQCFGISHGSMTTIHDMTNTQSIIDQYHKDLRRSRASSMSLIPTSTGSATAITEIFPELKGKINGVAVRVPLANASLTDCVFEVEKSVTIEAVNSALKTASNGRLKGILGYEELPLVSVDYTNDIRSGIIDAPSTMVINGTQIKLLVWYDNEIGYVNRMMELVSKVCHSM